jgi:hypothetical protein
MNAEEKRSMWQFRYEFSFGFASRAWRLLESNLTMNLRIRDIQHCAYLLSFQGASLLED